MNKSNEMHTKAYAIYESKGQFAVHDAVHNGILDCDQWAHCEPCEINSPMHGGACLVCGTIQTKPINDDPRQWDHARINEFYDQSPDLLLSDYARFTGRTVSELKRILMGDL